MISNQTACYLIEWSVYLFALFLCWNAYRQGVHWLSTLLWGMVAGQAIECLIVAHATPEKVYYIYNTQQFFHIAKVPCWVGVGWGIVLYASTWTAERLRLPAIPRALVAGALAVNIDLTLDPIAHMQYFWRWKWPDKPAPFSYFEVPFDNFLAWFGIVAVYGLFVRTAFHFVDRYVPRDEGWRWTDIVVPPVAAVGAGVLFWIGRVAIPHLYLLIGDHGFGEAVVFFVVFIVSGGYVWVHTLRGRRDLDINWAVLFVPIYFHLLSLGVFVGCSNAAFSDVAKAPSLLILIPMNLVVGFFAYAWPSLDRLLEREARNVLRLQRRRIAALLAPLSGNAEAFETAREKYRKSVPFSEKRGLLACRISETILSPTPRAELIGGPGPAPSHGTAAFKRVADAVAQVLDAHKIDLIGSSSNLESIADELIVKGAAALRGASVLAEAPPTLPEIRRETLHSYGGVELTTWTCAPRDEEQLKHVLAHAREHGWQVTFRAGGHAFDTQSLNDVLVVSLMELSHIRVDGEQATVGAGATWGRILSATLAKGFVPYVMPTTASATAGGTLAAHALSRFSPTCGREGKHVVSFRLVLPTGKEVECSRRNNPALFRAVISGLGYIGAVVEITYELMSLKDAARDLAVETQYDQIESLRSLAGSLIGHVNDVCSKTAGVGNGRSIEDLTAISAVLYMHGKNRGLVGKSRYTPLSKTNGWEPCPFHTPNSFFHLILQISALIPVFRVLGYWITFHLTFPKGKSTKFVDEVTGYTFFEDGNRKVKEWGRKIGLPMGIRQQSFVIPWEPGESEQNSRLSEFLRSADQRLDEMRLIPALIDVLFIPQDDAQDAFVLSSSRQRSGFIVTFTFEKALSSRFEEEERFYRYMSKVCRGLEGVVHLMKNVCADVEDIAGMYAQGITEISDLREQYGAKALLNNEFSRRVLPDLAPRPVASRLLPATGPGPAPAPAPNPDPTELVPSGGQ